MKIDRRCFLSLGAGVVVGTTLTPMPWKIMDDIAIWTQNWSWTPDPAEGPRIAKKTVCTLCPGGCGIVARRIGDRVIRTEGMDDHPVNRGSLCPLGLSAAQYLYGPSRVKAPMKRVGKRGSGEFQAISWEEAIQTVSAKLTELRNQGKPHSVACIAESNRGSMADLLDRFLSAYGSPNFFHSDTFMDAHETALYLTQGTKGAVGFDIANADFILSFGAGLLDGWGAAGRMFHAYGEIEEQDQLIQIESRLSDTASRASKWIAAKPGTEGALALGLAHVIVNEKRYNRKFIDNFAFGFADWTDEAGKSHMGFQSLVQQYTPSKVAAIAGIDKNQIISTARAFAKAKRPVAVSGQGHGGAAGSIDDALAVQALNALVGNINKPGGMITHRGPDYAKAPEIQPDETAEKGRQQPRIDGAGSDRFADANNLVHRLPEVINKADGDVPVQALLVTDANPVYTLPDTGAIRKAFDRIPFIVSFSTFMDETAEYADIILPNHHFLERYDEVPPPQGSAQPVISLAQPAIDPQYNTRHTGDAVIAIAKAIDSDVKDAFPWKDYKTYLKQRLEKQWKTLTDQGYWVADKKPAAWKQAFQTASGKYEFYPTARYNPEGKDRDVLPDYKPIEMAGATDQFPLVLLPYHSIRIASGPVASSPFMNKTVDADVISDGDSFVQVNPETARKYNLTEGDLAVIQTPKGEAKVRVNLFHGVMPGIVAMPKGLGRTAFSRYIADKGVNVNTLLEPVADPTSGLNTAWGIRAALQKA
ncbi:MAG: molybdopterin-containing oxidoreductase family protein [Thermodesulfobacteriota bacterium]